MESDAKGAPQFPDGTDWSHEMLTALIAQLHYDRADVARLSSAAATAMDIAIVEVMAVARRILRANRG